MFVVRPRPRPKSRKFPRFLSQESELISEIGMHEQPDVIELSTINCVIRNLVIDTAENRCLKKSGRRCLRNPGKYLRCPITAVNWPAALLKVPGFRPLVTATEVLGLPRPFSWTGLAEAFRSDSGSWQKRTERHFLPLSRESNRIEFWYIQYQCDRSLYSRVNSELGDLC